MFSSGLFVTFLSDKHEIAGDKSDLVGAQTHFGILFVACLALCVIFACVLS